MKIYNDLVAFAKSQKFEEMQYTEKHHIIMKSLGGSNDKSNIVQLTPRQHYIAHLLLYKHYKEQMMLGNDKTPYYKSLSALSALIQLPASLDENGIARRAFKFGSRVYDQWKIELSQYLSNKTKKYMQELKCDKERYMQFRLKISNALKQYCKIHGGIWTGCKHSKQTRQLMSDIRYDGHGENNSRYGSHWIYNLETFEQKSLSKDQPMPEGWAKGRFCNATPEELKERKKLVEEILKLDPNSKVTIRMNLQRLQRIYEKILNPNLHEKILNPNLHAEKKDINKEFRRIQREQQIREKTELLTKQYEFYNEHGWDEFVKEFDYQYSYPNFVQQCKKYVKSFVPQNGKKRGKK